MIHDGLPDELPPATKRKPARDVIAAACAEWAARHWPLPAPDDEMMSAQCYVPADVHATLPALVGGVLGHLQAEGLA